jgi:hypothetical protein
MKLTILTAALSVTITFDNWQRVEISNAASMSDADWHKILDLLSAWQKALAE